MTNISQDLEIHVFPCLTDNYAFLIHDPISKQTAAIDTPDAKVIDNELTKRDWNLNYIFNTHHHGDHVGGNLELKEKYHCQIIASAYDESRIPGIDKTVQQGDTVSLGAHKASVHETPGHTLGHIIYHFEQQAVLFVGDTLFSMGCGRLFEGSAEQMYHSLDIIKGMKDDTVIYCAHEYTETNARFALTVETENPALQQRYEKVLALREENIPTVPFLLKDDKQTNPFILAKNVKEFAERRQQKDSF